MLTFHVPTTPTRAVVSRELEHYDGFVPAIIRLKDLYGSHDKLAAALGTTRQRTITWTKGKRFPTSDYRDRLVKLGFPDGLLIPPADVEDVWRAQLRLEAEVAAIRRLLETLAPEPA